MAPDSQFVEEEKSSDDKNGSDSEISVESPSDVNDDDDANMNDTPPPVLQAQDTEMAPPLENQLNHYSDGESDQESDHEDERENELEDEPEDDDDGDHDDGFPSCYPEDPPFVVEIPLIAYPEDAPMSSPSARNLDFNRMVQNNFVPFSKGMKGEAYRKRTNYEHQMVMG